MSEENKAKIGKTIKDFLVVGEEISNFIIKNLYEKINMNDASYKGILKKEAEKIEIFDKQYYGVFMKVFEEVALSESFKKVSSYHRILKEEVSLREYLPLSVLKVSRENINLKESFYRSSSIVLRESMCFREALAKSTSFTWYDSVMMSERTRKGVSCVFIEFLRTKESTLRRIKIYRVIRERLGVGYKVIPSKLSIVDIVDDIISLWKISGVDDIKVLQEILDIINEIGSGGQDDN